MTDTIDSFDYLSATHDSALEEATAGVDSMWQQRQAAEACAIAQDFLPYLTGAVSVEDYAGRRDMVAPTLTERLSVAFAEAEVPRLVQAGLTYLDAQTKPVIEAREATRQTEAANSVAAAQAAAAAQRVAAAMAAEEEAKRTHRTLRSMRQHMEASLYEQGFEDGVLGHVDTQSLMLPAYERGHTAGQSLVTAGMTSPTSITGTRRLAAVGPLDRFVIATLLRCEADSQRVSEMLADWEYAADLGATDMAAFVRDAAKSDVCPKCKSHMSDVTVKGNTMTARCSNCGWSGTKTKTAGSLRDFMNSGDDDGKTGTCKHCGKPIAKRGGLWFVTGADGSTDVTGGDICVANKGTTRQYGGEHQPAKTAAKTAVSSGFKPGDRVEDKDGRKGTVAHDDDGMSSSEGKVLVDWDDPDQSGSASGREWKHTDTSKPGGSEVKKSDDDKGGNPFAKKDATKEARVERLIWQAASHDQDFSADEVDAATLDGVIGKYLQIVFYNEHGVAADYETGRIVSVKPDGGKVWRDQIMFHTTEFEWQRDGQDPFPALATDVYSVTRLEEPTDAGQQHLFAASRKTADAIQQAVQKGMMMGMPEFTNPDAMLPGFAYVVMEPGPNGARPTDRKTTDRDEANRWAEELLKRTDWSPWDGTKMSTKTAGIAWQGANHMGADYLEGVAPNGDIYEAYYNPNSEPTPCSWVNYGPGGDSGPNSGIASGRGFATMAEAVADAEQHAGAKTAARSRCTKCGNTLHRDATSTWVDDNGSKCKRGGTHAIPASSKHRASHTPDSGQQCPSCGQYEVHHYDDNGGYNYCSNCDWSDHPERAHTGSMLKGAPFAGYDDFEACVKANSDKDDPEAYCGSIKHKVEDSKEGSMANNPLPDHLKEFWGNSTIDPRDNPNFCPKQSRKTPAIPWHNGYPTCLSCGKKATFNASTGNVRYSSTTEAKAPGLTTPMEFECNKCHTRFEGTSPKDCPNCGAKPDQHKVVGHRHGDRSLEVAYQVDYDRYKWVLEAGRHTIATGVATTLADAHQVMADYEAAYPEPLAMKALIAHDQTAVVDMGFLWTLTPVGLSVSAAYFSNDSVAPVSTSSDGPKEITVDHGRQQKARMTESNEVLQSRPSSGVTMQPTEPTKASEVTGAFVSDLETDEEHPKRDWLDRLIDRDADKVSNLNEVTLATVKQSVNDQAFGSERYQTLDRTFPSTGWAGHDGFAADHSSPAHNRDIPDQRVTGWPSAWGQGAERAPSEGSLHTAGYHRDCPHCGGRFEGETQERADEAVAEHLRSFDKKGSLHTADMPDAPCPASDRFGGHCVYRQGHDMTQMGHRFVGGDEEARYQHSLEQYWHEHSGTTPGFPRQSAATGWLDAARNVVATNSHTTIDGMLLDQFSASVMVQVYDGLSEANQAKFAAMSLPAAHDLAFKIVERAESKTAATFETDSQGDLSGPTAPGTSSVPMSSRPQVSPSAPAQTVDPSGGASGTGDIGAVPLTQPMGDPSMGSQPDPSSYEKPTMAQRVEAKVAKMAKQIVTDNPTVKQDEAVRLARMTVAQFPGMVSEG